MIDDLLTISKCGQDSIISNAVINSFVESKRLELSDKKCHRIHIGKKTDNKICADLKVHNKSMNDSTSEKYIGDIISENGKITANISDRQAKGFGIVGDILAILDEILQF